MAASRPHLGHELREGIARIEQVRENKRENKYEWNAESAHTLKGG